MLARNDSYVLNSEFCTKHDQLKYKCDIFFSIHFNIKYETLEFGKQWPWRVYKPIYEGFKALFTLNVFFLHCIFLLCPVYNISDKVS